MTRVNIISNMRFADHLEKEMAEVLMEAKIDFIHNPENRLDFYLPEFDTYIEIKQFHSDRIAEQMSRAKNVIAIQGVKALKAFIRILKNDF